MNQDYKKSVKFYFDGISEEYSRAYKHNDASSMRSYIFFSRRDNILGMLDKSARRILDIGCGPAVFTERLLKNGCEVWGIDISEEMIGRAKDRTKTISNKSKVHFSVGDIEQLEFPDNFFDCVLCVGVLEYLNDVATALGEVNRVLKPGAEAIFTVPNMLSPFSLLDKIIVFIVRIFVGLLDAVNIKTNISENSILLKNVIKDKYYFPWQIDRRLARSGFKVNKRMFHIYRLSSLNAIFPSLALFIAKKLEFLSRSPLCWIGINYIIKANKK